MNVHGIGAIVKISSCAILAEEVSSVKVETTADACIEFGRLPIATNGLQGAEVVSGVKVIDPALRRRLAIVPGTIFVLLCGRVSGDTKGDIEKGLIACVRVHAAQESGGEEIRVMGLAARCGEGITKAGDRATVGPVELVLDVRRRAGRHAQISFVSLLLIHVQEGTRDKGGADQVRRPTRHDNSASLPREAIAPTPI